MTEEKIDVRDLITRAKPMVIRIVDKEWYEIEGSSDNYGDGCEGQQKAIAAAKLAFPDDNADERNCMRRLQFKQIGRPMSAIVRELNDKMKELGIEPQENHYSFMEYEWRTAEELRDGRRFGDLPWKQRQERPIPLDHRWIASYPVTGSNEGYYLHIDLIFQNRMEKSPLLKSYREMADLIDKRKYSGDSWQEDKALLDRARLALHSGLDSSRRVMAQAKTWDWENACACAAVAATLLVA